MSQITGVGYRAAAFLLKKAAPTKRAESAGVFSESLELVATGSEEAVPLTPTPRFIPFLREHLERGLALAERMVEVAKEVGGEEGLQRAMDMAEDAATEGGIDLAKYAMMVFITHHPPARILPIPPLEEREPEKVLGTGLSPVRAVFTEGLEAVPVEDESLLNYFREDALLNEHHEHWHVVYPFRGIGDPPETRKRQGELFLYMHEQMLARYDTERHCVGLSRLVPFNDYTQPIEQAYDPGPSLNKFYTPRPAGLKWQNMERGDFSAPGQPPFTYTVAAQAERRDRLNEALKTGVFHYGNPQPADPPNNKKVNATNLGGAIEASIDSPSGGTKEAYYGNLHNVGHVLTCVITQPIATAPDATPPGVMSDTATAVRDPFFYRWHRHIDDFYYNWQQTQKPKLLSSPPKIVIRQTGKSAATRNQSPDIILTLRKDIPGIYEPDFDWKEFGERNFGGANWDKDFLKSKYTTNTLTTYITDRPYQYIDLEGPSSSPITFDQKLTYLEQDEFIYFLRVENRQAADKRVTVRIFLVAQDFAEERRMWIEMDKFRYTLKGQQKTVIYRPASLSSVIRKPATKPPQYVAIRMGGGPDDFDSWCDCGWPYNLLLPRGTEKGMKFRFMVMLTDWDKDKVDVEKGCGSMSYCGARNQYPDRQPMGYPFDRPFAKSIAETFAELDSVATRDIVIKHLGYRKPEWGG
jgi:hypothetical protein